MNRFSERLGITPEKMVQIDGMDEDLRNRLWNAIGDQWDYLSHGIRSEFYQLAWDTFFKRPKDDIDEREYIRYRVIRDYYFSCSWNEAYDLIEFTCRLFVTVQSSYGWRFADDEAKKLVDQVNGVLESEHSGFRFVGKNVVQIASPEGVDAVENALLSPDTVAAHIQQALELFSSRDNQNYRNAISEAISAVEAMCRLITGDNKATLGKALNELQKHNAIDDHPALNKAFQNIYGYTSDAQGIRHAMSEQSTIGVEDAQFMIVVCSTFVNYLKAKAARAGIALDEVPAEEGPSLN